VTSAPYVFVWNDVPPGTYNLTTTVTDAAGASTTSATITGTVAESALTLPLTVGLNWRRFTCGSGSWLVLVVVACTLLGDALQDALNPATRYQTQRLPA